LGERVIGVNQDNIVPLIWLLNLSVCLALSVIFVWQKATPFNRFFPLVWQSLLVWSVLNSFNHGFPSEMFRMLVFSLFWALPALASSWWLSRLGGLKRVFSWLQLCESLAFVSLSFFDYAQSCYRHYGHLVWDP
jgi:hypothetical protein